MRASFHRRGTGNFLAEGNIGVRIDRFQTASGLETFDFRTPVFYLLSMDNPCGDHSARDTRGTPMRQHATLVSILHIVYSAMHLLGAMLLGALALVSDHVLIMLIREGVIRPHDVPVELFTLVPWLLGVVALIVVLCALPGLIAGIGFLAYREWARIMLLVVSFFSLVNVPLGTLLGGYSIWVLLQQETIALAQEIHGSSR